MSILEEIREQLDEEAVLYDGFEEALIGVAEHWGHEGLTCVALYDYGLCVKILMKQDMSDDEADEYLQFNVVGGYVGPYTPVFAHLSA